MEGEEAGSGRRSADEDAQQNSESRTEAAEDAENADDASAAPSTTSKLSGGTQQPRKSSSVVGGGSRLQTAVSDEQLNVDDVKRAITFSPSITDALADTIPPMREMNIFHIFKDQEQTILNKALMRVKEDYNEARVMTELTKMHDLYQSSVSDNTILEGQCHELQDKLRQYEARHLWDPRVLKVLLIAERYRQEKAFVDEEKHELEAEVVDMSIELKHLEDAMKNKNKDIAKLQEELKKAKETEKLVESLETVVMRKDNELNALQETYDALVQTNAKLENQYHHTHHKMSLATTDDSKIPTQTKEMMLRIDHLTLEKTNLKVELEDKTKNLQNVSRKLLALRIEKNELESARKEDARAISKSVSENNRLLNTCARLERKIGMIRDQLTLAKSEIMALKGEYEVCVQGTNDMSHALASKQKANVACQRQLSSLQQKISNMAAEKNLCDDNVGVMMLERKARDRDLLNAQRNLSDKKAECDSLTAKLFKLEMFRTRHLELLKLTRVNTTQMVKEISGLRSSLMGEKNAVAKTETQMLRMQAQIEALQREYMSALDKNLLLVRNQEMASAAIEQFEIMKVATDRRIAHLMKTNIDLYTQTTSQQEIALIQTHQFHLKENEIKGLLSRLEEEDVKMERMITKDKEKRGTIEQLHVEATSRDEKIKNLKGIIESYCQLNKSLSDRTEEIGGQLRATQTQRELIRRQRDLFGMKLLESRAETQLCQESLRTAKDTITKYSVDFYNMQNDIRVLKLEIRNLRRKNKLSEGHTELIHTLRQELGQACKAYELQKCKTIILEQTRMPKTHRWRALLASDPSKYEMVLKNQLLIRRLISKSKETAKLEELLKQKDTMYLSLRVLVERRMDSQLMPEMNDARMVMRKQHRQIKALTAELNMRTDDLSEAKAREKKHKEKLNEIAIDQAQERAAKFRQIEEKKTQLPPIQNYPSLPRLVLNHVRQ